MIRTVGLSISSAQDLPFETVLSFSSNHAAITGGICCALIPTQKQALAMWYS
jgi:hypothetical protein